MNKIIPFIGVIVLTGVVVFSMMTFLEAGKDTQRELETEVRIRAAISELRGDLDPKVTNEQLSWYSSGSMSLLTNMSREFKETGEIRFAPIIMDENGVVEREDTGAIKRGKVRVLIQKPIEFDIIE